MGGIIGGTSRSVQRHHRAAGYEVRLQRQPEPLTRCHRDLWRIAQRAELGDWTVRSEFSKFDRKNGIHFQGHPGVCTAYPHGRMDTSPDLVTLPGKFDPATCRSARRLGPGPAPRVDATGPAQDQFDKTGTAASRPTARLARFTRALPEPSPSLTGFSDTRGREDGHNLPPAHRGLFHEDPATDLGPGRGRRPVDRPSA